MISESSSFHTAIFDALCACLGLSKTSADAIALIHEAYAEPENVPQPPRNRNIIYWSALQEAGQEIPAAYVTEPDNTPGKTKPIVYVTLKYQLVVVCYGPASEAYASRIRSMLFLDGHGLPRKILRDAGIFPVPDPPQPSITYEDEGSLWRKRADLIISLRVRDEQQYGSINAINVAPVTIIHH